MTWTRQTDSVMGYVNLILPRFPTYASMLTVLAYHWIELLMILFLKVVASGLNVSGGYGRIAGVEVARHVRGEPGME